MQHTIKRIDDTTFYVNVEMADGHWISGDLMFAPIPNHIHIHLATLCGKTLKMTDRTAHFPRLISIHSDADGLISDGDAFIVIGNVLKGRYYTED